MEIDKILETKRDEVLAIAARYGARNVRIFGSVARGDSGNLSDLDLLVKMDEGRSLLDLSGLVLDLRELLDIKVDVVSEDGLYWLLRRRILKEARPL
jgi:predicted nucleotidyltransferase